MPTGRLSVLPRFSPRVGLGLGNYQFILPQYQSSNLSLPLRDRWKIFVAMDRLLVATGEQEEGERYGGDRYGDQRSEGGA